jgi:pyruvate/2-oxoglutarate/acetoin dehydrogenase E1 component
MGLYFDELCRAMDLVARQPNSVFIGQTSAVDGTAMHKTLPSFEKTRLKYNTPYDAHQYVESVVCENLQVGMSIGMALQGYTVLSLFPRINFMLYGIDQLINHLDKLPFMGPEPHKPRAIIRTAIGSTFPIDPGPQHKYNYTRAIDLMCKTINVVKLEEPEQIFPAYEFALESSNSSLIVEISDFYNSK